MEIYKNNLEYAKKNGEREQYLKNLELCDKCGAFIRHSIAVNFNFTTKYLDVKTITAEVTEKYGFERTMLMLALRVDSLKNDDFTGIDAVLVVVPYYNKPLTLRQKSIFSWTRP